MKNALVSVNEAAQQLGVSRDTIKNWGERGILSLTTVGKHLYVTTESIDGIKESAPRLEGQQQAVEALQEELEIRKNACMEDIRVYRMEKNLRKESGQRIILYMEMFASLVDLIYEGRYEEREYKAVVMFLKGQAIKDIAEELGTSTTMVISYIRKCNEILFNLQPYVKMQEVSRESYRKARLAEKNVQILRTMLGVCREGGGTVLGHLREDDVAIWLTPVDSLNLSAKTKKVLAKGRVKYVGDIVFYGEERLVRISGFGPSSLQEVKGLMAQMNQPMGARMPAWDYIKKAYGKQEPFVYEKLFELDAETNDYLETVLEDLPEDRAVEIRELFLGLFAMGEKYKENFGKYKQLNVALREDIAHLEKALKNEDYYLSPAYEEVKALFAKVEYVIGRKKDKAEQQDDSLEPAETALGLVDCIFNQKAYQIESRRMKENWQTIAGLEKKVKKLESQIAEKTYMAQVKAEKAEKAKEKYTPISKSMEEVYLEKIRTLEQELEDERRFDEYLARKMTNKFETETVRQLKCECEEAKKMVKRQAEEIKELEFGKKSRDLTIETLSRTLHTGNQTKLYLAELELREKAEEKGRILREKLDECQTKHEKCQTKLDECQTKLAEAERRANDASTSNSDNRYAMMDLRNKHWREVSNLWSALRSYEFQVELFNESFFFEKMWKKLEKFSDSQTETLTRYVFAPEEYKDDSEECEDDQKESNDKKE